MDKEKIEILLEYLKYYDNDEKFYLSNLPHKPSNINSKLTEKDINLIHPFKI